MTSTMQDRVRSCFNERTAHLPKIGPGLDALVRHDFELTASSPPAHGGRPWSNGLLGAAAVAVLVVAGLVVFARRGDQRSDAETNTDTPNADAEGALAPVLTLPDLPDLDTSPVTVAGSGPSSWFRIAPDVDVAWYQTPDGTSPSMFCWRTPVADDCGIDEVGLLVIASSGGDQTLVIAAGAGANDVQVQLDDGSGLSAPIVATQTVIDVGVARFALPDGVTIVSAKVGTAGSSLLGDPEPVAVTGATLPPAGDLIEIPLTVPAASPLAYWRFLPDLDISERQATTPSGTELCWRTPAGTGCLDDTFHSPDVGVIPTDGAAILLARPALELIVPIPTDPTEPTMRIGPTPTVVTVVLSDGTSHVVELVQGRQFGVGHARIDLQVGGTVISAISS